MKKVLLLHEWDYTMYNSESKINYSCIKDNDIKTLFGDDCDIYKLSFPGFFGQAEPEDSWSIDDYANYVFDFLNDRHLSVDYIVGYSFGSCVAARYCEMYDTKQKIIMVNPDNTMCTGNRLFSRNVPKAIKCIQDSLGDFYETYVKKDLNYINGTEFLKSSYRNLLAFNVNETISCLNPHNVDILFDARYRKNNSLVRRR